MTTHILRSEDDTKRLAQKLACQPLLGSLWLSGDLGAGKTTFTRYFLQALGHVGAVKSPTYTLVEPYRLDLDGEQKMIYHCDLYRLNDPEELDFIGFFEYYQPDSYLIIEWASKALGLLPAPTATLDIQTCADGTRRATITGFVLDDF